MLLTLLSVYKSPWGPFFLFSACITYVIPSPPLSPAPSVPWWSCSSAHFLSGACQLSALLRVCVPLERIKTLFECSYIDPGPRQLLASSVLPINAFTEFTFFLPLVEVSYSPRSKLKDIKHLSRAYYFRENVLRTLHALFHLHSCHVTQVLSSLSSILSDSTNLASALLSLYAKPQAVTCSQETCSLEGDAEE